MDRIGICGMVTIHGTRFCKVRAFDIMCRDRDMFICLEQQDDEDMLTMWVSRGWKHEVRRSVRRQLAEGSSHVKFHNMGDPSSSLMISMNSEVGAGFLSAVLVCVKQALQAVVFLGDNEVTDLSARARRELFQLCPVV